MDVERIAKVLQHRPATFSHGDSVPVPLDLVHAWDDHELEIVLHARGAGIVSFDGDQQNRFAPDTIEIYPRRSCGRVGRPRMRRVLRPQLQDSSRQKRKPDHSG
jgi:hypothetical protein